MGMALRAWLLAFATVTTVAQQCECQLFPVRGGDGQLKFAANDDGSCIAEKLFKAPRLEAGPPRRAAKPPRVARPFFVSPSAAADLSRRFASSSRRLGTAAGCAGEQLVVGDTDVMQDLDALRAKAAATATALDAQEEKIQKTLEETVERGGRAERLARSVLALPASLREDDAGVPTLQKSAKTVLVSPSEERLDRGGVVTRPSSPPRRRDASADDPARGRGGAASAFSLRYFETQSTALTRNLTTSAETRADALQEEIRRIEEGEQHHYATLEGTVSSLTDAHAGRLDGLDQRLDVHIGATDDKLEAVSAAVQTASEAAYDHLQEATAKWDEAFEAEKEARAEQDEAFEKAIDSKFLAAAAVTEEALASAKAEADQAAVSTNQRFEALDARRGEDQKDQLLVDQRQDVATSQAFATAEEAAAAEKVQRDAADAARSEAIEAKFAQVDDRRTRDLSDLADARQADKAAVRDRFDEVQLARDAKDADLAEAVRARAELVDARFEAAEETRLADAATLAEDNVKRDESVKAAFAQADVAASLKAEADAATRQGDLDQAALLYEAQEASRLADKEAIDVPGRCPENLPCSARRRPFGLVLGETKPARADSCSFRSEGVRPRSNAGAAGPDAWNSAGTARRAKDVRRRGTDEALGRAPRGHGDQRGAPREDDVLRGSRGRLRESDGGGARGDRRGGDFGAERRRGRGLR